MMPDEPTPEDRMELREAYDEAEDIIANASDHRHRTDGATATLTTLPNHEARTTK